MHRSARLVLVPLLAGVGLLVSPRVANAQEGGSEAVAVQASRGPKIGVGPTLVLPLRSGGPYGAGLTIAGDYGVRLGPTVVAPGGRLDGYRISDRVVGLAMPTVRLTVPIGPLAPYLVGGIGVGGLTSDGEWGMALLGGGGLMVHIGRGVAFGAEATYQSITGTELNTVTVTPAISFGG